ncbi:MAG: hypothetical protein HOE11_04380 [Candidatus Diapherotrites archaeon]|jgi:hypothetical protein|nr:hypothetical protein [Candidatus Diapherotrites archaeon]
MRELRTFEDTNAKELESFREQLRKSGGKVLIIMHPYWSKDRGFADSPRRKKQHETFLHRTEQTIKKSKLPVIVFEGGEKWSDEFEKTQKRVNALNEKVLLVPTKASGSQVVSRQSGKARFVEMKDFAKTLHSLGIRDIKFGGSLTGISITHNPAIEANERKWLPKRLAPARRQINASCAGGAYAGLCESGLFNSIKLIPETCYPNKPEYIRNNLEKTMARLRRYAPKRK